MKCVFPGSSIKVFGRSIHALSKIGHELYWEPLTEGLTLRTVNSTRSAYACYIYAPSFFLEYEKDEEQLDEQLKCKIGIRSCIGVFKSLSTLEKTVDKVEITTDKERTQLVFRLICRHDIVKTHNLSLTECETLQAVVNTDNAANTITSHGKMLSEAVMNFHISQDEVTLSVQGDKISLVNFTDDEPDQSKVIRTEMRMTENDFEFCDITAPGDVTFCLKELRAILGFAEYTNLPLTMRFTSAGSPIIFSLDADSSFRAHFVLATMSDNPAATQSQRPHTSAHITNPPRSGKVTSKATFRKSHSGNSVQNSTHSADLHASHNAIRRMQQESQDQQSPQPSTQHSEEIPIQESNFIKNRVVDLDDSPLDDELVAKRRRIEDEDEEEDTLVQGTPPPSQNTNKHFLFAGFSQATQKSQKPPPQPVLAADTDDED